MLQFGKAILLDSIIFVNIHFSIEVEFGIKSPVKSRAAKANLELPKQFAFLYFLYQFKNKNGPQVIFFDGLILFDSYILKFTQFRNGFV